MYEKTRQHQVSLDSIQAHNTSIGETSFFQKTVSGISSPISKSSKAHPEVLHTCLGKAPRVGLPGYVPSDRKTAVDLFETMAMESWNAEMTVFGERESSD